MHNNWCFVLQSVNVANRSKIFYGSRKRVEVNRKSMRISDLASSETQAVRVNVPRGFPAGGTLQSEISQVEYGLEIKSMINRTIT